MKINPPYQGKISGSELIREVPMKLYFISILGRDPIVYEWESSPISREGVVRGVTSRILEREKSLGVPHIVTAFPHITCVYRWGDPRLNEQETNFYAVGYGTTSDEEKIDLTIEPSAPVLLGCPAEMHIFEQENRFRQQVPDLETYLQFLVQEKTLPAVANTNMIQEALQD